MEKRWNLIFHKGSEEYSENWESVVGTSWSVFDVPKLFLVEN